MSSPTCPWCGSTSTERASHSASLTLPFSPSVLYSSVVVTCAACGERGDFGKENGAALSAAKATALEASIPVMLDELARHDCSMAYFERALELPARTVARWKTGERSAAAVALLRAVTTFPWLLEVADHDFDRGRAAAILIREAGRALLAAAAPHQWNVMYSSGKSATSMTVTVLHQVPGPTGAYLPSVEANALFAATTPLLQSTGH